MISEKSWNSLTQRQREILGTAAKKSSVFQRELWKKSEESAEAELKKKGVEFVRADKNLFRAKTAQILARYSGEDAEIVKEILEAKKK